MRMKLHPRKSVCSPIFLGPCLLTLLILTSSCGLDQSKGSAPLELGRLEFDQIMEFVKGVPNSYTIEASMPDGSEPVVQGEHLPEGARFESLTFTWTPSCDLSHEDGYFYRGYTVHHMNFTLQGTNKVAGLKKNAAILIHEQQQGVKACP